MTSDPGLGQSIVGSATFERHCWWETGGRAIEIVTREHDGATGTWFSTRVVHEVDHEIAGVHPARGDLLAVAGVAPDGDAVLELWRIPAWPGGWNVVEDGWVESWVTLSNDEIETVLPSADLDWSEFPHIWAD